MAYTNTTERKGTPLGVTISGNGLLPVGYFEGCKVISVCSDNNILSVEHPIRGVHTDTLTPFPTDIHLRDVVDIEITLSRGVYGRQKDGELALFDSTTHQRVTEWTDSPMSLFTEKFTIASPQISLIKKNGKVVWSAKDREVEEPND